MNYKVKADIVRKRMIEKDFLTIGELAKACNVEYHAFSRIFNGKRKTSAQTIRALAIALDLPVQQVVEVNI